MFFVTVRTIIFAQHSSLIVVVKWTVFTEILSLFTAVTSWLIIISPNV